MESNSHLTLHLLSLALGNNTAVVGGFHLLSPHKTR